jgi:hypothetical protein
MAERHSAKRAGFDCIKTSGIVKRRRWHHVFITDSDAKARSLRNQTLEGIPGKISVYSAVFDVGRSNITITDLDKLDVSGSWLHAICTH